MPAGSEKRARGAEVGEPGSPSKRLKIGRQMSLGTVLRHVESQGQARGSLDSHVGAKPITVEDMTGEGPERKRQKLVEAIFPSGAVAGHCQMLLSCWFITQGIDTYGVSPYATGETAKRPFHAHLCCFLHEQLGAWLHMGAEGFAPQWRTSLSFQPLFCVLPASVST